MDQKYITLFDEFTHTGMGRRLFLDRLAKLAGGTAAAAALLPILENNYAQAATLPREDPRIETGYFEFPAGEAKVRGYYARPKKAEKFPGVVVIHENRGLNPHIEDITRRLGVEGFFALAPDALSRLGGTPADADKARDMIGTLDFRKTVDDYAAAVEFLQKHERTTGKTGCVGFCWGGGMANQLAIHAQGLDAAVSFYGMQPEPEDAVKIAAPLQLHYAGLDERINKGIDPFRTALDSAKIRYELWMYEGVNHAFMNDTNAARYNPDAATLAWGRTIAFLKKNLG
jgi:carboxymethylenebutenolidase